MVIVLELQETQDGVAVQLFQVRGREHPRVMSDHVPLGLGDLLQVPVLRIGGFGPVFRAGRFSPQLLQ